MNKENDMEKKNKKGSLADRIPHQVWLLISFAAAMALWTLLSSSDAPEALPARDSRLET